MITKDNALAIAKAIVNGMNKEIENRKLGQKEVFAVRGAALNALDNLWYDVLPDKTRSTFGYSRVDFLNHFWK